MHHRPDPTHRAQPSSLRGQLRTGLGLILLASAGILSVATSSPPPVIETVEPGIGASSVGVDEPLQVRFEQPVDGDTVTTDTVRLRRLADDALVEASLELTEGRYVVRVTPLAPLAPQTDYALELDLARLSSQDGETFVGLRYDEGSESVWETSGVLSVPFTTRRSLTVARAFRQSDPDEILVYFSEPVDPAVLTLEAVRLTLGGEEVAVDLRYNETENRLRLLPLEPLAPSGAYTVHLDGTISTPDGIRLGAGAGDVLELDPTEERIR
jgi:hypothetical protein